ncbi:MAG TPA: antitoxin, partial [Kribbella sp.]|nr:antitoxin [Kribbella sp.]
EGAMNDFQEQAKNWLRNVVKQNPDKIKAGVEKAGDLIDKQTGGKYAEKVDAVQQKVGTFVDKQTPEDAPAAEPTESAGSTGAATSSTTQDAASSADTSGSSASADATSTDATSTDGSQR